MVPISKLSTKINKMRIRFAQPSLLLPGTGIDTCYPLFRLRNFFIKKIKMSNPPTALYESSFGKSGQGVNMGKINPKANGKFFRGSNGPPHVLELLYAKHVEREERVAMTHPTKLGATFPTHAFGPSGSVETKMKVMPSQPRELTDEERRAKKISKAVLQVLRKEGFGNVRKDLKELQRLRKEQDNSIELLQKSIPKLKSTLRRLA